MPQLQGSTNTSGFKATGEAADDLAAVVESQAANLKVTELVSVIIPAYNAAETIDETLCSVRAQTWQALEVVVVDDGSQDDTALIAHRHAAVDPRVRVIQQNNAGVAAARNRAISCTSGRYIAAIDADDLWARNKIERQMEVVYQRQRPPGLVYTWFCVIDANSVVRMREYRGVAEGSVLAQMCRRNIVGTGSNALMLRSAIEDVGGYDPSLRARNAQGSEDYDIYLRIAERYDFAVVREYLTGYRELTGNMSSDVKQMIASRDLCVSAVAERHPHLLPEIADGRRRFHRFMVARLTRQNRLAAAMQLFGHMLMESPTGALSSLAELGRDRIHRRQQEHLNVGYNQRFEIGIPDTAVTKSNAVES